MTETRSEVEIDAPAARVWRTLAHIRTEGRWNLSNRGIVGHPMPDDTIETGLRTASGRDAAAVAPKQRTGFACAARIDAALH
jgi:hypothetical protein